MEIKKVEYILVKFPSKKEIVVTKETMEIFSKYVYLGVK